MERSDNQITTIVDGGNTITFETTDGSSVSNFRDGVPTAPLIWHQLLGSAVGPKRETIYSQ